MIKVKLCAFSDEADPSLEGQIAALKRNNVPYMEMRGVNGKNVTALWTFQLFHSYICFIVNRLSKLVNCIMVAANG